MRQQRLQLTTRGLIIGKLPRQTPEMYDRSSALAGSRRAAGWHDHALRSELILDCEESPVAVSESAPSCAALDGSVDISMGKSAKVTKVSARAASQLQVAMPRLTSLGVD